MTLETGFVQLDCPGVSVKSKRSPDLSFAPNGLLLGDYESPNFNLSRQHIFEIQKSNG
jgi:hypothetical protein